MRWSFRDVTDSLSQGWGLFFKEGVVRVEKADDPFDYDREGDTFASNEEAFDYVLEQAEGGSPLALKALAMVARNIWR